MGSWYIPRLVFGHLYGVFLYQIDVPEVVISGTVRGKQKFVAIWGIPWVGFVGHA